jgi:hypothetical protein
LKGCVGIASKQVDFRDQQGVYVLYDDNYAMLYVGQAGGKNNQRLFGRLKQHRTDHLSNRWTRFSWFGVQAVDRRSYKLASVPVSTTETSVTSILNHIEAILIVAGEPPLNRQGGRFGAKVKQYFQVRDEKMLGPDQETMLKQIWSQNPIAAKVAKVPAKVGRPKKAAP